MKSTQTPSIIREENACGPVFVAQVREIRAGAGKRLRTYLGRWPSEEQARAVCRSYIETGARPGPQKRGMKAGQKKRAGSKNPWLTREAYRAPRPTEPEPMTLDRQAKPLATAERLARIGVKSLRPVAALPVSCPETGQDRGNGAQGQIQAISALTPEQRAERLEQLKAAYRRTA